MSTRVRRIRYVHVLQHQLLLPRSVSALTERCFTLGVAFALRRARLTTEECLDHRWLLLNQQMVKGRKTAVFSTDKLKLFEEAYIKRRQSVATPSAELLDKYGKYAALSDEEDDVFGGDH